MSPKADDPKIKLKPGSAGWVGTPKTRRMMHPKISRYGRKRVMSAKANEATSDANLLFFGRWPTAGSFLMWNLIDPTDLWRYMDEPEEEPEPDVDDYDAPNIYPYKKCSCCSERSSCGNYNDDKEWVCEDCGSKDE